MRGSPLPERAGGDHGGEGAATPLQPRPFAAFAIAAAAAGAPLPQPGASGTPNTPPQAGSEGRPFLRGAEWVNGARAAAEVAAAARAVPAPALCAAPCAAVVPPGATVAACRPFYSLIADGVHVHPYAVSLAFDTHPAGLILVTDAVQALGLPPGAHAMSGLGPVEIVNGGPGDKYKGLHVVKQGTDTLAGAVVPLNTCLNNFLAFTGAPLSVGLKAVTSHPAAALGLANILGTLHTGAWADMVLLRETAEGGARVAQTWVGGMLGWQEAGGSGR